MTLPQILCALLSTICGHVTSVEAAATPGVTSGADKKASVMQGVASFLDGLISQGVAVVRNDVEAVAGRLIDTVVTEAHALGAFTHAAPPAPAGPAGQP